jgi:Tol biopolymer transport system component
VRRLAVGLLLLVPALLPGAAQAAYPGENGRIAFVSNRDDALNNDIYSMNADGSDVIRLTTHANGEEDPAWSPDGTKIAFGASRGEGAGIYTMNADGTTQVKVSPGTLGYPAGRPSWSPDGTQIVFQAMRGGGESVELYAFNADGSGTLRRLTLNAVDEWAPAWSPDGTKIAFHRFVSDPPCSNYCNFEIFVMNSDGTGHTRLTFDIGGARQDTDPDWSPDGSKLTFQSLGDSDSGVQVMDADGSGRTGFSPAASGYWPAWSPDGSQLTWSFNQVLVMDADGGNRHSVGPSGLGNPSWQPVQRPYVRPAGATPVRVSLVPAFAQCASSNRTHGPPLAFPSCNPPQPASPNIVVSDGERRIGSVGYLRAAVAPGEPGGADDADLRLIFRITNVLNKSDLSDYTGIVQPELVVRLTDREGFQSQTTQDFPFRYSVPCVATDTAVGGLCALTTSAEAIVPGSITEGSRAIWAIDKVRVYDGGPAGDGANASLFATQGIFVP